MGCVFSPGDPKYMLLTQDPNTYKMMFAEVIGITYPARTLKRRIGFLTKTELKKIAKLEKTLNDTLEKIQDIIAMRAEVRNDSWP